MKVLIKSLYFCVLLSFSITFLTGCENKQDNQKESLISTSGAEMQNESGTLQPTDTGIVISSDVMKRKELCKRITMPYSPQTNICSNYYADSPDFPVDGQTSFTCLAQAIINTSAEDEIMYFLVYINDSKYSVDLYPEIPFSYEGESVNKIQSNYENASMNRYNYYQNLKNGGMSDEDIEADPEYIKLGEAADKLFAQLIYARSARFYEVNKETIVQYIGYFEELGFEQLGDINDDGWQRRMTMSGGAAKMPIMFGISGTLDDIERLCDENNKYGTILFSSDSEGHWIERNNDPNDRRENTLYLYEIPGLYSGQVYYSYQELGIYERIWKID